MRRKKTGNRRGWPDSFSCRARAEHYPARSVYKLQEIQKKFGIIKRNDSVFDLGCSPGSWLLYAARLVGPGGMVSGIDRKPVTVDLPPQVTVLVGDILAPESREQIGDACWDAVLSDMAPSTTGSKQTDAARSFYLATAALEIAARSLRPGGNFVCKIFQGEDFQTFTNMVKNRFTRHKIFKPDACRSDSRETYVIGLEKKENEDVRS